MPSIPASQLPPIDPNIKPLNEAPLAITLNPSAPLNQLMPSSNPLVNMGMGLGPVAVTNYAAGAVTGAEIPVITFGLNALLEDLRKRDWFPDHLTVWILLGIAALICVVVYYFLQNDPVKAVTNTLGVIGLSKMNVAGAQISGVGVIGQPVPVEHKWSTLHPKPASSDIVIANR